MNRKDSEDLVRVGPGTVMGELMRQYWVPAAMSAELEGAARRRCGWCCSANNSSRSATAPGRVGIMDHPPAPLRLAVLRAERGQRHPLHLSRPGNSTRTASASTRPTSPATRISRTVSRPRPTRSSSAAASSGSTWERAEAPPLPEIEATSARKRGDDLAGAARMQLAAGAGRRHRHLAFRLSPCRRRRRRMTCRMTACSAIGDQPCPAYTSPTPMPARCTRLSEAEPGRTYWRFANFMLPFWTQTPQGKFTEHLHNRAWVPMDDPTRCSSA